MPGDISDEAYWKHISENLVPSPSRDELVDISTMTEKQLVELFD
jgi:hypothetical protein